MKPGRKYKARASTPLKPFKPETGLSKRLEDRIARDLVHTNKTFTEIARETGVPTDFISTLCYMKKLRTIGEHREIATERGVETRRRKRAAKEKVKGEKGKAKKLLIKRKPRK